MISPSLSSSFTAEVDSPDVVARIEKETGQQMPATYRVRSRKGRGHFYFRQNSASIAMGNISQAFVKGQDWSARVDDQYVIAPGSIHPETGKPYEYLDGEIQEAPDWLIYWCLQQRIKKNGEYQENGGKDPTPRDANNLVPHGAIHGWLLTQAGKLRAAGMNQEEIEPVLLRLCHENCAPPIDDQKVKTMARSICNFPIGVPKELQVGTEAPGAAAPTLVEVREVRQIKPLVKKEDILQEAALASTRLGDMYTEIFQPNGWPLEMALPSLVAAASVLVPPPPKQEGILLDENATGAYVGLIGPLHIGKSQCIEWGAKAVGIYTPSIDGGPNYANLKFGSAEQLFKYLSQHQKTWQGGVLINIDEWAHMMQKASIDRASMPTILTTMFNRRTHQITVGGYGGGKTIVIPDLTVGFAGGIVEEQFGDVFGASTLGGLYDRFIFGKPSADFKWSYREYPHPVVPFNRDLSEGRKPCPVTVDGSVYEVTVLTSDKSEFTRGSNRRMLR